MASLRIAVVGVLACLALSTPAAALCTSYPNTLTNGTTADGGQVMANFNCAALTSGSTINGLTLTGTTTLPGSGSITSTGSLGIQTGSPAAALDVSSTLGTFNPTGGSIIRLTNPSSTGQSPLDFFINGTLRGRVRADYAGNMNYMANGGVHVFFVGGDSGVGTEAGRFATNGSLLVGTTTNGGWAGTFKFEAKSTTNAVSGYTTAASGGNALYARVDNTASHFAGFAYNGTEVGTITTNGSATSYNTTSDARLKDTTVAQRNYRDAIAKLWVGDFKWKADGSAGFGIVAQQAYTVFPQAVQKPVKDADTWQADYSKLAPLALWGVKDLYRSADGRDQKIAQLESQISNLRRANADLNNQVDRLQKENTATSIQFTELMARVSSLEHRARIRIAQR